MSKGVYVVVDLEMCNVPKKSKSSGVNLKNEIIQIGAALIDESMGIVGEFMTLVSPEWGIIDTYIENLTGISQKDVEGAPRFEEAVKMFFEWLPKDAILVSWSNNDKAQITKELEKKSVVIEEIGKYLDSWIDCQKTFGERMSTRKNYKLSEALVIADIDYDEGAHDALVDAKNTARLFLKMEREEVLVLNSYYSNSSEGFTNNVFSELLANYSFAV